MYLHSHDTSHIIYAIYHDHQYYIYLPSYPLFTLSSLRLVLSLSLWFSLHKLLSVKYTLCAPHTHHRLHFNHQLKCPQLLVLLMDPAAAEAQPSALPLRHSQQLLISKMTPVFPMSVKFYLARYLLARLGQLYSLNSTSFATYSSDKLFCTTSSRRKRQLFQHLHQYPRLNGKNIVRRLRSSAILIVISPRQLISSLPTWRRRLLLLARRRNLVVSARTAKTLVTTSRRVRQHAHYRHAREEIVIFRAPQATHVSPVAPGKQISLNTSG